VLPWFIAVEHQFPGFTWYFITYHHFQRFAGTGFNNPEGLWFYPAVLFIGMLPWSVAVLTSWRSSLAQSIRQDPMRLLGPVWFTVVLVFFSLPRSKLIGYMFPLLPAFAILFGPWFAAYGARRAIAGIGAVVCVCAPLTAASIQPTGPIGIAAKLRQQIAPGDAVVFVGGYLFDVAIMLNRPKPSYVVGDWSKHAAELHDSIRRQFTEGREFEPRTGYLLINDDALNTLLSDVHPMWIWADKRAFAQYPELRQLPVVASQSTFVLLYHGD
jgi:hypothetical protein